VEKMSIQAANRSGEGDPGVLSKEAFRGKKNMSQ